MYVITLLLFCLCFVVSVNSDDITQPKVTLKDGTEVLGLYDEFHSDALPVHAKLNLYYGIPYAEAPMGPLRFKPPVPKGQLDSPYNATAVGKSCLQMDPNSEMSMPVINDELSEDCLFLDVLTPHPKPENAPVLFSIHGGGFQIGAGQMPYASFRPPVAYGNIIIVTINYRLGYLGFLTSGDELIPGNIGLLDQQLALKWVHENIEAFGGNPASVTIFGISAGSGSVGFHSISPSSAGLFNNAIMQSGSPLDPWLTYRSTEYSKREVKALAKSLGCSGDDIQEDSKLLECLMDVPAEEFVDAANMGKVAEELGDPAFGPPGPVIDGTFLPNDPASMIKEGKLNADNFIVGTNAEEGTVITSHIHPDKETKPVVNSTMFGLVTSLVYDKPINSALHDLIKTIYAPDPAVLLDENRDDFFKEATQYLGDRVFMCPNSRFARMVAEHKNVYRHTMTYVPSHNFMGFTWAGAAHGDDGQFVCGTIFDSGLKYRDEERLMSRIAMQYWINFVKTGNPNTPEVEEIASVPSWPRFVKEDELFKDLSPLMNNIYMKKRECYFLEHILPGLREAMDELDSLKQQNNKVQEDENHERDHQEL